MSFHLFFEVKVNILENVIFVCAGNTCRSAMAKYIMRKLVSESDLKDKIFVDSAGCQTSGGKSMGGRTREVLEKNNIPFDEHISKLFTREEYNKFDYVIALDEKILETATEFSDGDPNKKIRLFKNLDGEILDIDDPFVTGDFQKTFSQIFLGCSALLKEISTVL